MSIFSQNHIEEIRAQIQTLRDRRSVAAKSGDIESVKSIDAQIRQRLINQGEAYQIMKGDANAIQRGT